MTIRLWRALAAALLVCLAAAAARAEAPVLRIETGGHGAQSDTAATDAAGRVLVTAGEDKTARIWSLPDLRPLGVLRPPIGAGNDGKLYSVAVSPDGTLAAIGGWIGSDFDDKSILVFDLATRQVVHRISGLPNTVTALAFSTDGRLAAGFASNYGIRVWETQAWRQVFADGDYHAIVNGLSFAADGRLAAGSYDAGIRLYNAAGRQLARISVTTGRHPFRMAFSPDGARLAIGFENALELEVRDGRTLALLTRPSVAGLDGTFLSRVAWAADGHTLLGSGDALVNGLRPLLAWADDGAGARRTVDHGWDEPVFTIVPLPSGNTALVSSRGALAVVDGSGQRLAEQLVVRQDLNTSIMLDGVTRRFLVSRDGTQVGWVAWGAQNRWLRFDGAGLGLTMAATRPADLADWSASAGSQRMTDWSNSPQPALNGHVLTLDQFEWSRSVAVSTERVLVGADYALRLFAPDGFMRWRRPIPGTAWRVNQGADGRLAVSAYDDGTIRWHRLSDGQELLALFVTADASRWVAWTPSGYYAASAGGEDLIGWHVNRGADQAGDFFAAGRFRDRYYRPDIVRRVLSTLDEAAAVRQADQERGQPVRPVAPITDDLPPVIAITSPRDGTQVPGGEATIGYTLRSPSGKPVRGVRVLIDGRPAPAARGVERVPQASGGAEARGEVVVAVPAGQTVDVALLADTESRTSEPAKVRLVGAASRAAPEVPLPRLNVVAVGVSAYPGSGLRLEYAAKDATDFAAALSRQRGAGLYREVNVTLLTDAQATRGAVIRALDQLRRETTSNDVAVVFLAGHGVPDEGRTFFLPVDGDVDSLFATSVAQTELDGILSRVPGKVVAFLDICHAGGAVFAQATRGVPDIDGLVNELRQTGSGVVVFAAATSRQPAVELPELGHGAFTAALLEGLAGGADYRKRGSVRTDELNVFVADRVRELTHGRQSPVMQRPTDVPDFPLVIDK